MRYINYLLLSLVILCCCSNALAVTYYVDASNGNNSWSGTTPNASSTNGPWQSIDKVNAAPLQPGDQILFSCGQTWYEPLKPHTNGTTTAKIYFGSYPSQCNNKPKITGFQSLPSHNWQPYQGNIWKTTFPQNLIINSSLSESVANWTKWPSDARQTFNANCPLSVAGCMNFIAGANTNSLVISNPFPIIGGQKYAVTLSIYAPSDTSVWLIVRENGNSYRSLGLSQSLTGNGQWQNISVEFTAKATIPNARFDIEVPKTKQIFVQQASAQQSGIQSKPNSVLYDGNPISIAHHPNAGHDITRPNSVYLRTSAASPIVTDEIGQKVSSQIMVPDLKLPSGGSVGPGTKLKLRPLTYQINDFSVTGAGTNTLSIAPNTSSPLSKAGWGFYFYDAKWMLDSPGEWFFDNTTQTIYLWTPTSENPGYRVSVATNGTAIDLSTLSNMTVENLEIDGASTGVDISNSKNVTLRNLNIYNIAGRAIEAKQSMVPTIATNHIIRAGLSAIHAYYSTNAVIENNVLSQIGVFLNKEGTRISLPMKTEAAIFGGYGSLIQDNFLSDIGSSGITSQKDNDINSNVIQRSCFTLNDCSGIYLYPESLGTVISSNLILEVPGDLDGTPNGETKLANGIYLDDGTSGISVTGNTVKGATDSIHIHNGGQNTISNNILYGSERGLIWQQEDSTANGGISGNIVTENQFFPTAKDVAIYNTSLSNDVFKFATYDNNHYSTIQSPIIVTESGPGFSKDYNFMDWQTATNNGIQRDNDLNGDKPAPLASFAVGIVGHDFMTNGDFSDGLNDWGSGNAVAPYARKILEGCLPVSINCMHVIAGASETYFYSPKFQLLKGKLYRVTFDMKSSVNTAYLYPTVRFAGPNKFTTLVKTSPDRFAISTDWKRHFFVFEANESAVNPTIADQGARLDIGAITPGLDVWIANVEITPFDPGVSGPTRSDILVNITDIDKTMDCPTRNKEPGLCSNYVGFPEGTASVWPISVPPRSGRIVFTQNLTLLDSDGDGIADSQDECTNTDKGLEVNGKGCSLVN